MKRQLIAIGSVLVCCAVLAGLLTLQASALPVIIDTPAQKHAVVPHTDLIIYDDATTWDDWSWSSTIDLANTAPVQSGAKSIAVTFTAADAGFSLRTGTPIDTGGYTAITFWAHGGSSGTRQIIAYTQASDGGSASASLNLSIASGSWTLYTVTLAALGNPAAVARFNLQDATGAAQPTFYVDNIRIVGAGTPPPPANTIITLTVDVVADRKAISPDIYGLHYSDAAFAAEIDLPVRRWGGNDTTRYNWQTNAYNHGSDWYFENDTKDMSADQFIARDRSTGAKTIMTMPLIGWTPKDATSCGFSIAKYGAQQATDPANPARSDCGNGVKPDNSLITGNDPTDTSAVITTTFVTNWINHFKQTYGTAANGGVAFYNLDNEPDLWFETHRDVFPIGLKYDQYRDLTYNYAAAIKAVDPSAKVLGPVVHGWTYYFHSPYDGQRGDWITPDDRNAHGGTPFVEWYLQQMQAYQQITGTRLIDYFDLHYYPQAPGVTLASVGNANTQALRLRSTRSLWDATYVDESWISAVEPGTAVRLLPRMHDWVNGNYPGTQLAITEYNWGALDHINGALAQADVLGIFGREGVGLATFFDTPYGDGLFTPSSPGAYAFRMYRNYDGAHGKFGDVSVSAASSDQSRLSIYAAQRSSDNAVTLMIINKAITTTITGTISLANFTLPATAQIYRYSAANLNTIVHLPDQAVAGEGFTAAFPANSITLVVLAGAAPNYPYELYLPLLLR